MRFGFSLATLGGADFLAGTEIEFSDGTICGAPRASGGLDKEAIVALLGTPMFNVTNKRSGRKIGNEKTSSLRTM